MKIGILSDTHRNQKYMDKAIKNLKDCNLLIHAGDNFLDSKYLYNETDIPVIAVKGNCDFENVEDELIFDIDNKKVFLCHGDSYEVKYGLECIEKKAKEVNADIVIFGHTHIPLNTKKDNILYINPGSLSSPRDLSRRGFIILNIKDNDINIEDITI